MSILSTSSRDDFLGLTGLNSGALNQRASLDQIALAFGREVPSEQGQYLAIDPVFMELVDQIAAHAIMSRKHAATLVRLHHPLLLNLVQKAEWGPNGEFVHLAVGWVQYFNPNLADLASEVGRDPRPFLSYPGIVVYGGTQQEIAEAEERRRKADIERKSPGLLLSLSLMNIKWGVLPQVRARARKHDIKLPPSFTAKPGTPEEEAMLAEIADYQKRSQDRLRAKGRRRAPVPRSMRMFMPEDV